MIAEAYGPLRDLFDVLRKHRENRQAAAETADRIVFNVCRELDRFEGIYLVLLKRQNVYPLEVLRSSYDELVIAIEEARRNKVVRAAIEGGRQYHMHNPHLSKDDEHFREFDIGRTLLHIRNSARRMMEQFELGYGPETWPVKRGAKGGTFFGPDGVERESPQGELRYGKYHLEITWGKFQTFSRKFRN